MILSAATATNRVHCLVFTWPSNSRDDQFLSERGVGATQFRYALSARREAFTHAGLLLGATERLNVATGIANVWARDAMAMAAAQKTLAEAYPGRFLLGMGVSHAPLVAGMRGHDYKRPLT